MSLSARQRRYPLRRTKERERWGILVIGLLSLYDMARNFVAFSAATELGDLDEAVKWVT